MSTDIMHETKTHGQLSFPFIVYRGMLPEYIDSYPLHWHEEFEIIYIQDGKGFISVQSQKYECSSGDIFLIAPKDIHSIDQQADCHMEYYNILFQFSLLEENPNSICYQNYFLPLINHQKIFPNYVPPTSPLNQTLLHHILFLIQNRKVHDLGCELLIKSNLFALIHYINENTVVTNAYEISKANIINKIKNVLLYLKENYSSDTTIEQASSISGFSESHFMKIFKQITGKTFTQYLNTYRLEIAAKELINSNKKIIDISQDVGFNSFSYFIRSFTKKYGVSPSIYRNQL
jgi:AraC-like DNA-binding protein